LFQSDWNFSRLNHYWQRPEASPTTPAWGNLGRVIFSQAEYQMELKLTKSEIVNIESDGELMGQLAHADIIAVDRGQGDKPTPLWMRPQAEIVARGLPANVQVMVFATDDEADIQSLSSIVKRLKQDD
jgi:hypothetical protein